MPENRMLYWDACVFLSYINDIPDRVKTIQAILDDVGNNDKEKILTSTISKVEVAFSAQENLNRALIPDEEAKIDALWDDASVVELIDLNEGITALARDIMREGITRGWKIRPNDAIHLASAKWINAREINTYDDKLPKFQDIVGIPITYPTALQPKLFL